MRNCQLFSALPFVLILLITFNLRAEIPEPGNIIYGTVKIGDNVITAEDTSVSVNLRINNTVISTYKMGENSQAGNNYILKIPIDTVGEQLPETARPGDLAEIYIGDSLAVTLIIGERGDIINANLSINLMCQSQKSGPLLDISTYNDLSGCGTADNNYVISSGHTVTWDGSNGPLTGYIIILEGGVFEITAPGGIISGQVNLNSGTINVLGSTEVAQLIVQTDNSILSITQDQQLTISTALSISQESSLQLTDTGTLAVSGVFMLEGVFIPGSGTLDVRGGSLVMANDLNMTGAQFLSDASVAINLHNDVTITTDQPFSIGALKMNEHSLALGSADSDLTIVKAFLLDHENERLLTGDADVTFLSAVTMIQGEISSSGGSIYFTQGGELSGGTIDISGTGLVASGNLENNGVTFTGNGTNTSKPIVIVNDDFTVSSGDTVNLDGSRSYDFDGTVSSYQWTQISGPDVVLEQANQSITSFIAPFVGQKNQELVFRLIVEDNSGLTNANYVTVTVLRESNPGTTDTDGDQIPDFWENIYGLNPNDASDAAEDWDYDTYTNLEEYQNLTNPNVADTLYLLTPLSSGTYSSVTDIVAKDHCVIETDVNVIIKSGTEIRFQSGFEVKAGGELHGFIDD